MLTIEGLVAGYHDATVLHDINLSIGQPAVHVLVGHNGAGKTTLLHTIAGLIHPTSGHIRLDGLDLTGRPAHHVSRAGTALVPQGRRIWPSLTVHDHLHVPRRKRRSPAGPGETWTVEELLGLFPPLAARLRQRAGLLSGGEQQMLAICRALLTQPSLLLLDEPTEGLAPALAEQILNVVTTLPTAGTTVLTAIPDAATATRTGEHLTVITTGRITANLTGADARAHPARLHQHLTPATSPTSPSA